MNGFLAAVQFLTRVPIRLRAPADPAAIVVWFPVVGALIGATVGGIVVVLEDIVPMSVAVVLAVLAGLVITGAFHEDGLADTADAIAGGWTAEQRLTILTDPRHGTYGVAALAGSIVLRVSTVATLDPTGAFVGLVAAHTLGRGVAVVTMGVVPVARPEGLGADYARSVDVSRAAIGGLVAVGITAVVTGWWVAPLVLAAVIGAVAVAVLARRAFGGITGDVLGAIEQVAECLVLVAITALATRYPIWWR